MQVHGLGEGNDLVVVMPVVMIVSLQFLYMYVVSYVRILNVQHKCIVTYILHSRENYILPYSGFH